MFIDENAPALECRCLYKSYSKLLPPVLANFSLSLPKGKIVGLLGPNGCGKSTLIKLIAGLLVPDMGSIYIAGRPRTPETNSIISYLPERTYLSPTMTVEELVHYFKDFYSDFSERAARSMLAELGIQTNTKLKTLSKGGKEKVQLIMVMARRARLYLLDEPIAGVDPAARDYILRTVIGNYSPESTVLITTHLIHDIESALDDFYFMGAGGQILMSGSVGQVKEETGKSLNELFKEVFRCYASY